MIARRSVLCLLFSVLLLCSCQTYSVLKNPNATPKEKAQAAIQDAETGLKFTVGPAVTTWLLLQKDPAQQAQDAAMVYGAATALNSLATGAIPTPTQVQTSIQAYTGGSGDPRYQQLSQALSASYSSVFGSFQLAQTSPAQFFAIIATNAQTAAQPFLTPPAKSP
jgi:hypothetical protein